MFHVCRLPCEKPRRESHMRLDRMPSVALQIHQCKFRNKNWATVVVDRFIGRRQIQNVDRGGEDKARHTEGAIDPILSRDDSYVCRSWPCGTPPWPLAPNLDAERAHQSGPTMLHALAHPVPPLPPPSFLRPSSLIAHACCRCPRCRLSICRSWTKTVDEPDNDDESVSDQQSPRIKSTLKTGGLKSARSLKAYTQVCSTTVLLVPFP